MYADITAAASVIKVATDLTKLIFTTKVDSAVAEKARELLSEIISLQDLQMRLHAEYQRLMAEKQEIEQRLMDKEKWDKDAANYTLQELSAGVFAYGLKEEYQHGAEPLHWLCANCYHNDHKSILQRRFEGFGKHYFCPHCHTEFPDP